MNHPLHIVLVLGFLPGSSFANTLEGRVVEDRSGDSQVSATVRILRSGTNTSLSDFETDTYGHFRFGDVAPGAYRLEVSKPGFLRTVLTLNVSEDKKFMPPLIRLVRCGSISGSVTDFQGRPVVGARVFAMTKSDSGPFLKFRSGARGSSALADESGRYRLFNLPPGQFAVAVSYNVSDSRMGAGSLLYPNNAQPQLFSISGSEELRGADFSLQAAQVFVVDGTVEIPVPDAKCSVSLVLIDDPAVAVAKIQTESGGRFHFRGIPKGSYDVLVTGPVIGQGVGGSMLGADSLFGRVRIEVSTQDLQDVSISLTEGTSIGLVLRHTEDSDSKLTCSSAGDVTLMPIDDWGAMLDRRARVGFDRAVPIHRLAPGRYLLTTAELGDSCYQVTESVADLTRGSGSELVAVLVGSAGSIYGRIVGVKGPTDHIVTLLASHQMDAEPSIQVTISDPEFHFSFTSLRPGKYWIGIHPASPFSTTHWTDDIDSLHSIEVAGEQPTDVQLDAPQVNSERPSC
jgi:hypothetical protein